MYKRGFTLAEILITLAIIGIVAALTIPSVMTNVQQRQFETGYRKAINVLNDAIQTNLANDGTTPYALANATVSLDLNGDGKITIADAIENQKVGAGILDIKNVPPLAEFLMKPLNVVKTAIFKNEGSVSSQAEIANFAFYTTDGMRFEVPYPNGANIDLPLYESDKKITNASCTVQERIANICKDDTVTTACGSMGLLQNPNKTTTPPCLIIVDVNGDKKPNPTQLTKYNKDKNAYGHPGYTVPKPEDGVYMDVFPIMITDRAAVPYGAVAQRTLYDREDVEVQTNGN